MADETKSEPAAKGPDRRAFLKGAAGLAAAGAAGGVWTGCDRRVSRSAGKKVIIIGIDGMDPRLTESLIKEGLMPNFNKMRSAGGFSDLGTSIPPQSPVAWANFINGAGPGSHGIFDFIHRHPEKNVREATHYSVAETKPGGKGWEIGDHEIHLDFWPFSQKPPATVLKRQGIPFWDYLDAKGIPTTFYDLPSNYPASPSTYGHHRCLCGMGTPDLNGGYSHFQFFEEKGPDQPTVVPDGSGTRSNLDFHNDTAKAILAGPPSSFRKDHRRVDIEFLIHRDKENDSAIIEIQGKRIMLKPGMWSRWIKVEFDMTTPSFLPGKTISGICRFYLQSIDTPHFHLYVSPININPADPAVPISEPASFLPDISKELGLFYTTGFQEEYAARKANVFDDEEYLRQANMVLEERLALFEYAIRNYDDGLLFFYFSSSDLQSHMFWWDSKKKHPCRTSTEAKKYFGYVKQLYQKLDAKIGDIYDRYGSVATIIVMSDHGFSNWGRQFNLNSWLRKENYIYPREATSIMKDVDWSKTIAYGLGINGLYLNLKGRELNGVVDPGDKDMILKKLIKQLTDIEDDNGQQVIGNVYRADKVYSGDATAMAPDLIVGYNRGYRASWVTCMGEMTEDILLDNVNAWSADHCADALQVPGLLCCNHAIQGKSPTLVDIAPSILTLYGVPVPATMSGQNILG